MKSAIRLGVVVVNGKNHEKYTTTLPFGPQEEVDVDLSGFAPGMGIKMLPNQIPIEYKKFPDGRSVIGLGLNADDEEFWEAAKEGELRKYSFEELADLWNKNKIYTPSATMEIRWVVLGYAVSTDDDPDSMTGVIQCYSGGTANVSESVGYITYGVNFTMNAGTDQVFVMKPDDDPTATLPDEFQTELDLNAQAGTEIYAGVGIPFTSACVYGGATLTTEGQLFPEGGIEREYVDGKVYIKVTLMNVPLYTYTLLDGHKDLYPETEEDGTVVYRTDMDMCAANEDALKELLANGYGNTPYNPVSPEGKQVWLGGTDLISPDINNGGKVGDSPCAKKIASNVYPESGIQVTKLNGDKSALVAFISNNNESASDNKGELSWMKYDNDTKTITEPLPVAGDIDGDGKEDTGSDFGPRLRRNIFTCRKGE